MLLRVLAAVCGLLLISDAVLACTLVAEAASGRALHESGDCDLRNSPASTFKLPLAVMGFDAGLLRDPHGPVWPYRQEYRASREAARRDTDPSTWLKDSIVWYSQELTRKLGQPAFQRYVDSFGYGNRDLTGDPGKANGLTQAWLGYSSLQISPREQVTFLRRLLERTLPVSPAAQDNAIASLPVFSAAEGWIVRGKTGSGFSRNNTNGVDRSRNFGWFVGWADRPGRPPVVFARLTKHRGGDVMTAGPRARDSLLADLPNLIGR